jgi:MFS family permease
VIARYARMLKRPGLARLMMLDLVAKLSSPMVSVALLLAAVERFGSYGVAGAVLSAHAFAVAAGVPVGGRLVDRYGPRRVMTGYVAAHAVAYTGVLLAFSSSSPTVLVGAVVVLGATTPPAGPLIRGALPRVVDQELLSAAYALDSAINETAFILGPLLVAALMTAMPAHTVVILAGALMLVAPVLLVLVPKVGRAAPAFSDSPPARSRAHRLLGPLAHRPTLILLLLAAFGTFAFGALRIATAASATALGVASAAGVLMGLLSVGALLGALGYGARTWQGPGRLLLVVISAAEAAAMLTGLLTTEFIGLSIAIVVIGFLGGARDSVIPTLLADSTPASHRTEIFAWLNTFMWVGYGVGTSVTGALTGPASDGSPALGVAAAVAALGAVLALTVRSSAPTCADSVTSSSRPNTTRSS